MAASAAGGDATRRKGCCFAPADALGPGAGSLLTYSGGRWKLWGEQEAAVEAWHSDQSEVYTAACFDSQGSRLALGCASGRVQVWDPHGGELAGPVAEAFHAIGRGASDCVVSAVAASQERRASVFASCGTMAEVLEVGVLDGTTRMRLRASKGGVCSLAASLSGPEWLLAAGTSSALKLWHLPEISTEVVDASPRAKFAAAAGEVTCLDLLCLGSYVLALCSSGSTQVSIFSSSTSAREEASERQSPLQASLVLSCHERIRSARFASAAEGAEGGTRLKVVGFGASVAAYWSFGAERATRGNSNKAISPAFAVTAEDVGARLLCARLVVAEGACLVVAFGPQTQPTFSKAHPSAGKGSDASIQRLVSAGQSGAAMAPEGDAKGKAKAKSKASKVHDRPTAAPPPTVLGPLESKSAWARPQRRAHVEAGEGAPHKRQKLPEAGPAPGGLSIAPMVRQGLRAKDTTSIDKVLETADRKIIDSTVAELTGPEAFDLLQECSGRLLSQPVHGQRTCSWIQRVLLRHCAYLCSQPVLQEALQPMREALRVRCSSHDGLVRLRGKLHALRAFGMQAYNRKLEEKATVAAPLLTYVEGDEDADEASSQEDEDAGDESDIGSDDVFDEDIFDDDDE